MLKRLHLGWTPDLPDSRDFLYCSISPDIDKKPIKVDLSEGCSSIEDQGKLGSCTAQALAGNLEYVDRLPDQRHLDVSRLFLYYNERIYIGMEDIDSGAMLRDGIKTLKKDGVCDEKLWPYYISKFAKKPSPKCYEDAKKHRIKSYFRIETLAEMLLCLADGYPFVFGFAMYESFMSYKTSKTGVVSMPKNREKMIGGHAVMAVGYDEDKQEFLIRNSWSRKWGRGGYFTMPYDYLDDEDLAADFWTIRR